MHFCTTSVFRYKCMDGDCAGWWLCVVNLPIETRGEERIVLQYYYYSRTNSLVLHVTKFGAVVTQHNQHWDGRILLSP